MMIGRCFILRTLTYSMEVKDIFVHLIRSSFVRILVLFNHDCSTWNNCWLFPQSSSSSFSSAISLHYPTGLPPAYMEFPLIKQSPMAPDIFSTHKEGSEWLLGAATVYQPFCQKRPSNFKIRSCFSWTIPAPTVPVRHDLRESVTISTSRTVVPRCFAKLKTIFHKVFTSK